MIKKVSLFFSAPIRKRIQKDIHFECSVALKKAVELPSKIVTLSLNKTLNSLYYGDAYAKELGGGCWKYFTGTHAESDTFLSQIYKAQRMEALVTPSAIKGCIALHISFFEKGEKNPLYRKCFAFEESAGEIYQEPYHPYHEEAF